MKIDGDKMSPSAVGEPITLAGTGGAQAIDVLDGVVKQLATVGAAKRAVGAINAATLKIQGADPRVEADLSADFELTSGFLGNPATWVRSDIVKWDNEIRDDSGDYQPVFGVYTVAAGNAGVYGLEVSAEFMMTDAAGTPINATDDVLVTIVFLDKLYAEALIANTPLPVPQFTPVQRWSPIMPSGAASLVTGIAPQNVTLPTDGIQAVVLAVANINVGGPGSGLFGTDKIKIKSDAANSFFKLVQLSGLP